MMPLFAIAAVVVLPVLEINLIGKLAPLGPILLLEIVLLSFPVVVPVPKVTAPPRDVPVVTNEELKIEQFVTVLLVASALKLIVAVPAVAAVDKFAIVSELLPVFNPSIVTLSAPLKSISGAAAVPRDRSCRRRRPG